MENFGLFLQSLYASWMVWAGAILRLIPFFEQLVEPALRKHSGIDAFLTKRGTEIKTNLKRIALICLFIGCYRAWVFEHKNTQTVIQEKAEAWSKYNECDKQLASKITFGDSLSSQVAFQQNQLLGQQATFNSCMLALQASISPKSPHVKIVTFGTNVSLQKTGTLETTKLWLLIGLTTKNLSPLDALISCKTPFHALSGGFAGINSMMGHEAGQISDHEYSIGLLSPPWMPDTPIIVTVASDNEPSGCQLKFKN